MQNSLGVVNRFNMMMIRIPVKNYNFKWFKDILISSNNSKMTASLNFTNTCKLDSDAALQP